jgi:hypothetical protein
VQRCGSEGAETTGAAAETGTAAAVGDAKSRCGSSSAAGSGTAAARALTLLVSVGVAGSENRGLSSSTLCSIRDHNSTDKEATAKPASAVRQRITTATTEISPGALSTDGAAPQHQQRHFEIRNLAEATGSAPQMASCSSE